MKKLIRAFYVLVLTLCSTALAACELSLDSVKSELGSVVDSALGFLGLKEEEEVISAEDALLTAGCTIQITAIKAVVAQSVKNAR